MVAMSANTLDPLLKSVIAALVFFALVASLHPWGAAASVTQLMISKDITVSAAFSVFSFLFLSLTLILTWPRSSPVSLWDSLGTPKFWGLWALGALYVLTIAGSLRVLSIASAQNTVALGIFVSAIALAGWSNYGQWFEKLFLFLGPAMAIVAILELTLGINLVHNQQLAQILPLAILLFVHMFQQSLALTTPFWIKAGLVVGLVVLLTGVLSTGQRMASAISVVLLTIVFIRRGCSLVKSVATYLLGASATVIYSFGFFLLNRALRVRLDESADEIIVPAFLTVTSTGEAQVSLAVPNSNGRLEVWGRLLSEEYSWLSVMLGRGTGSAVAASADIANPHSEYVRFFYDLGIIGLIIWAAFLTWALLTGLKMIRRYELRGWLLIGAVISIAAFSLTSSILLYTDAGLLWGLLLGTALRDGPQSFSSINSRPGRS